MIALALSVLAATMQGASASEADFYRIVTVGVPKEIVLEVSGLAFLPDGKLLAATRRGDVWTLDRPLAPEGKGIAFGKFTDGLQEPLGLLLHDGWIWCAQRGELSRMRDVDGDGRVDELETVCDDWRISGNYHEYTFGPVLGGDGALWMTTNKPFGDEPFGRVDWRGWAISVDAGGRMTPRACGLRSPSGIGTSPEGVVFYSDNQGEWCGTSKLAALEDGDFHGHPHGLFSARRPEWRFGHPGDPPDGKPIPEVARAMPSLRLPAVWFPYDEMGRSASGFVWDTTGGTFGPFAGQVFIGDQYSSEVMRVSLEKVRGRWQGACHPFVRGLACGIVRLAFAPDGSLFAGLTNRGWPSVGPKGEGLQRILWTGKTPFEVHTMSARADGFELRFTEPVDAASAADAASYAMESWTYRLHSDYGSPKIDEAKPAIVAAEVSGDGATVHLRVDGLREGYVHALRLPGVRSRAGAPLLHPVAYYTLNAIP